MVVLEGRISVEAALRGGARVVSEILALQPGDRRLARLRAVAAERGVPLRAVSSAEIEALASGRTHGGVVGLASERRYLSLDQLLAGCGPEPFVVMLDGVEDPYNFGAAVRALHAAGTDGLVVRPRNWESAAGTVARASAGASELMPTAVAESSEAAAETCRGAGLRIVCAVGREDAVAMNQADLGGPLFLLIGGERRGITRSLIDHADLMVRIPYARAVLGSLGTAEAAAVLAFEVMRQRAAGVGE